MANQRTAITTTTATTTHQEQHHYSQTSLQALPAKELAKRRGFKALSFEGRVTGEVTSEAHTQNRSDEIAPYAPRRYDIPRGA
jgi:hypothetical protein